MEDEAETFVASAHDAGGQSEAGPRRAEAGASIAGSGSLSALAAEEAVISSTDLVRWAGQVESEVRRVASRVEEVSGSLSSRVEEIAGSVSSIKNAGARRNIPTSKSPYSSWWTTTPPGATPRET